jgi:hypothetical protein
MIQGSVYCKTCKKTQKLPFFAFPGKTSLFQMSPVRGKILMSQNFTFFHNLKTRLLFNFSIRGK